MTQLYQLSPRAVLYKTNYYRVIIIYFYYHILLPLTRLSDGLWSHLRVENPRISQHLPQQIQRFVRNSLAHNLKILFVQSQALKIQKVTLIRFICFFYICLFLYFFVFLGWFVYLRKSLLSFILFVICIDFDKLLLACICFLAENQIRRLIAWSSCGLVQ